MKNAIIRKQRVHYTPGWDCHGLPIELKASAKDSSSPLSIRQGARNFAAKTMVKQSEEFMSWGLIGNWDTNGSDVYKTVSPQYIQNELKLFYDLYEKGLVFRDLKPVYWSTSSKTALAEAELEYDHNYKSPSLYFRVEITNFPISGTKVYAIIWTTTPWTLIANEAVCFNQQLNYSLVSLGNDKEIYLIAEELLAGIEKIFNIPEFKILSAIPGDKLHNLEYVHPLNKSDRHNFFHADHVSASKGTGLVHTAPAHGFDDYLVSLKHNIRSKSLVDEDGFYTDDTLEILRGKNIFENGNDATLNAIQDDIIHLAEITHSYPIDWRTKKPVFIRASDQWFINTERIKSRAIQALANVQIYPQATSEASKNSLIDQLEKRPYWCISRQRSWGVPIPVFYRRGEDREEILCNREIIQNISEKVGKDGNIDFWWTDSCLDVAGVTTDYNRGNDIMDIWFDSGISWSNALEGDQVADLYLEGIDQFTGWFQSSLMTSIAVRDKAPYKSIFVHGFALDEKGQKMSKSLGNTIVPKDIIKEYGIDTLRWWVAAHAAQHTSIAVGSSILDQSRESVQRIRAVLKYLLGIVGKHGTEFPSCLPQNLTHLDRYILVNCGRYYRTVFSLYDTYQFNRVSATILNFISNDLSAIYLHLIKDRLYCGSTEERERIEKVCQIVFYIFLQTLWPITSHLVEECWSYCDKSGKPFYVTECNASGLLNNTELESSVTFIEKLLELKQLINKSNQTNINTWFLEVDLTLQNNDFAELVVRIMWYTYI